MGREIRRVPKNWKHPKKSDGFYQPLSEMKFFEEYEKEIKEIGEEEFENENGFLPNINDYMPEGEWYQLFENTSEGTPLSPPFKTKEELKEWLINNVDYWNNKWSEKSIDMILNNGFAFSGIMTGGKIYKPSEQGDII